MEVIIVLIISAFGTVFYDIDFCTLHTFISIAVSLCAYYANDKTTKR